MSLLVALREHTSLAVEFHNFLSQVICLSSQCKNCKDRIDSDILPRMHVYGVK